VISRRQIFYHAALNAALFALAISLAAAICLVLQGGMR